MSESESSASHVGPIIFADETARTQLVEEGEVITFRTDERTTGDTWWRESRTGEKRGDVTVEKIRVVDPCDPFDLTAAVDLSGFGSVQDWQSAIESLNGGEMPDVGILYRARSTDTDGVEVNDGE